MHKLIKLYIDRENFYKFNKMYKFNKLALPLLNSKFTSSNLCLYRRHAEFINFRYTFEFLKTFRN